MENIISREDSEKDIEANIMCSSYITHGLAYTSLSLCFVLISLFSNGPWNNDRNTDRERDRNRDQTRDMPRRSAETCFSRIPRTSPIHRKIIHHIIFFIQLSPFFSFFNILNNILLCFCCCFKTWVLRVSIHCEGCKRKIKKLLSKIDGETLSL